MLPGLPPVRLAQSENLAFSASKTDSFVLMGVAGDVKGLVHRVQSLKQRLDAPHQVRPTGQACLPACAHMPPLYALIVMMCGKRKQLRPQTV